MASAFLLILHGLAAIIAFVTRKRDGGLSEGVLALAFMGIIFAVGWTISTMLTNFLFTTDFFIRWYYHHTDSFLLRILRKELNRDTISLLFLTLGEVGFYYLFLRGGGENPKRTVGKNEAREP